MIGDFVSGIGSAIGGYLGYKGAKDINRQNLAFQSNAVQTRVKDAKKAGVHPLAALGMSPYSVNLANPGAVLGEGISTAARTAGSAMQRRKHENAQQVRHFAEVDNLRAQAEMYRAQAASALSRTNANQDNAGRPQANVLQTPLGAWDSSPTVGQQDVEDQYGGVVGEVYGIGRALWDALQNVDKKAFPNKRPIPRPRPSKGSPRQIQQYR